jgi:hypothetical protein
LDTKQPNDEKFLSGAGSTYSGERRKSTKQKRFKEK